MANITEKNWLVLLLSVSCQPSLNAYIFSFLFFFFFSLNLVCSVFFSFNFPSWCQFNFVSFSCWKFNFTYFSHNYDNYAMFRDVPECSMFLVLSTAERGPSYRFNHTRLPKKKEKTLKVTQLTSIFEWVKPWLNALNDRGQHSFTSRYTFGSSEGGGGELPYEKARNTCQKIWIKEDLGRHCLSFIIPLKDTT